MRGLLELVDLIRESVEVGVHGLRIVAPPPDREVLLLDALPVQRHASTSLSNVGKPAQRSGTEASSGRNGPVELALEVANLIAQLGGVLEPQVLSRGEHLLFKLDDRAFDLGRRHAPDRPLAPTA